MTAKNTSNKTEEDTKIQENPIAEEKNSDTENTTGPVFQGSDEPVNSVKAGLMATIISGILAGRGCMQDYMDDPHYRELILNKAEATADRIIARCKQ